jgi:hypothetical protein
MLFFFILVPCWFDVGFGWYLKVLLFFRHDFARRQTTKINLRQNLLCWTGSAPNPDVSLPQLKHILSML